ncbi:MAG: hypothetical protein ACK5A0_13330 [Polaromonas sp.]|jgi:hypothetical protein
MKFQFNFLKLCGFWRLFAYVAMVSSAIVGQAAWAQVAAATHCSQEEKIVFSCPFKNKKTVSLCASADLTKDAGTLQYRYGVVGKKPELEFPNDAQKLRAKTGHPSQHFTLFSYTESSKKSKREAQIWFEIEDFHYGINGWQNSGSYVLDVYEYQAPADRGTKQVRSLNACIKNQVIDNLISLKNIGIHQPVSLKF